MEVKSLLYVVVLVTVELLTVTALKQWSINKNHVFLALGLLGYLVVGAIFAFILHIHSEMTVVNSLWQVMNIILVSTVGLLLYKEKLSTTQYVGVVFAIVATVLLSIE